MNAPAPAPRTPATTRILRNPSVRFALSIIPATIVLALVVEPVQPGAPTWLVGGVVGAMGYLLRRLTQPHAPGHDGTIEEAPAS